MSYIHITLLLIIILSASGAGSVITTSDGTNCSYIVTSNGTCAYPNSTMCQTFESYILNQTAYFKSNTIFCFLAGTHLLNSGNLEIKHISNITFKGLGTLNQTSVFEKVIEFNFYDQSEDRSISFQQPSTIIRCENSSGFYFNNMNNLSLINISILDCGANITDIVSDYIQQVITFGTNFGPGTSWYAAILMINVSNLLIDTVSVQNSSGYGFIGINVLGECSIQGSSFVGNNQLVKGNLQLYDQRTYYCLDGSYCSSCTPPYYANIARDASPSNYQVGGNAVFIYTNNTSGAEPVLNISQSLFTLGIDASLQYSNDEYIVSMGTGLSIITIPNMYYVQIYVSSTVTYRNQASFGSNMNFNLSPASCNITLYDVTCTKAMSYNGALQYYTTPYRHAADSRKPNSLIVVNSTFSVDMNWYDGFYTDIRNEPEMTMQIINCNMLTNFKIFSSNSTSTPVLFVNTLFTTDHCWAGIGAYYSSLSVFNCSFDRGYLYAYESSVQVFNSTFSNSIMSGILLYNSHLSISGTVSFINNSVLGSGGAISLTYTDITLNAPVDITFINNSATFNGGAVFIDYFTDYNYAKCMIHWNDPNGTLDSPGIHLYFEGNHAIQSGNVLYGGDIDTCPGMYYNDVPNGPSLLTLLIAATTCQNNGNMSAMISSDPRQICGCTNVTVNCTSSTTIRNAYPGQAVNIPIISVGRLKGASPDFVLFSTCDVGENLSALSNCTALSMSQPPQQTLQYCTNYSHILKGKNNQPHFLVISLLPRSVYMNEHNLYSTYHTYVKVLSCPFGFEWNDTFQICSCNDDLIKNNVQCDIDTLNVTRTGTLWVGTTSTSILAVHQHCPYDQCTTGNLSFSLNHQDEQCVNGHSGVLCGGCKPNLSIVLGSTTCKQCNEGYTYLWLLVLIALMGIAMVSMVFIFNCTVSAGTVNGLILYANIIRPGIISLLPAGNQNSFFTVFIDWMNLNFGIETCFYSGMDTCAKTWLEFVFPSYVLTLVGAIIIGSRWSSKLAWLCKRNAVPVLATLILLSYTRFLSTVLTIFSSTQLLLVNATHDNPTLWLADSNVEFWGPRHLPLFIAGVIVTTVFIIPYTLLLLLSPWLQAHTDLRCLLWVNKLKPFIDAYQGPFKDRYRYWPGIQLMVRVVLYLVFATNQSNDISTNLLAIIIVTAVYSSAKNVFSVYKNSFVNAIEMSLILNVACVSVALLFIASYDDLDVVIASMACGFAAFLVIIAYHSYRTVKEFVLVINKMRNVAAKTSNANAPVNYVNALEPTEESPLLYAREPLISR